MQQEPFQSKPNDKRACGLIVPSSRDDAHPVAVPMGRTKQGAALSDYAWVSRHTAEACFLRLITRSHALDLPEADAVSRTARIATVHKPQLQSGREWSTGVAKRFVKALRPAPNVGRCPAALSACFQAKGYWLAIIHRAKEITRRCSFYRSGASREECCSQKGLQTCR